MEGKPERNRALRSGVRTMPTRGCALRGILARSGSPASRRTGGRPHISEDFRPVSQIVTGDRGSDELTNAAEATAVAGALGYQTSPRDHTDCERDSSWIVASPTRGPVCRPLSPADARIEADARTPSTSRSVTPSVSWIGTRRRWIRSVARAVLDRATCPIASYGNNRDLRLFSTVQ